MDTVIDQQQKTDAVIDQQQKVNAAVHAIMAEHGLFLEEKARENIPCLLYIAVKRKKSEGSNFSCSVAVFSPGTQGWKEVGDLVTEKMRERFMEKYAPGQNFGILFRLPTTKDDEDIVSLRLFQHDTPRRPAEYLEVSLV